jgi:hypothetical protein
MKRYQAAMDNNYLLKILAASRFEPAASSEVVPEIK